MVTCQGFLTLPEGSSTPSSTSGKSISSTSKLPPKGTYYSLLQDNGALAFHRGNPYHTSLEEAEDGTEVARIQVLERGWNTAKRVGEEENSRAFELIQEKVAVRKGSSGIGFAQNIFKLRSKSVSGLQTSGKGSGGNEELEIVEPLTMYADDSIQATKWIEAFNKILSTSSTSPQFPPSLTLSPSPSFSSFSLQSSRRPSKPSPLLSTIPLSESPIRRPSFLSHPPQSPRSNPQVSLTEPSPPPKRRQSVAMTVPLSPSTSKSNLSEWVSLVKSSTAIPSPPLNSPQLKSKLSISSLTSIPLGPSSTTMERTRSDGRSSVDSRGSGGSGGSTKRFFGLLKKSKKEVEKLNNSLSNFNITSNNVQSPSSPPLSGRLLSPPQLYNPSSSTVSLSESLLSELHAGSLCSSDLSLPFTPNLIGSLGLDNVPLSPPPSASLDYNNGFLPQPRGHHLELNSKASTISRQSNRSIESSLHQPTKYFPPPRSSSSINSRTRQTKVSSDLASLDSSQEDIVEVTEFVGADQTIQVLLGGTGTRRISTSRNIEDRRRNGMVVEEELDFNLDTSTHSRTDPEIPVSTSYAEYIIKPQDLITQMSNESRKKYGNLNRLPPSASMSTLSSYNHTSKITSSPSIQSLGGLSPRLKSNSRQNLNLLAVGGRSANFSPVSFSVQRDHTSSNSISRLPRSTSATTGWFDSTTRSTSSASSNRREVG